MFWIKCCQKTGIILWLAILLIIANLIYKEGKIELGQTISGKDKTVFSGKDNEILVVIFFFFSSPEFVEHLYDYWTLHWVDCFSLLCIAFLLRFYLDSLFKSVLPLPCFVWFSIFISMYWVDHLCFSILEKWPFVGYVL